MTLEEQVKALHEAAHELQDALSPEELASVVFTVRWDTPIFEHGIGMICGIPVCLHPEDELAHALD